MSDTDNVNAGADAILGLHVSYRVGTTLNQAGRRIGDAGPEEEGTIVRETVSAQRAQRGILLTPDGW